MKYFQIEGLSSISTIIEVYIYTGGATVRVVCMEHMAVAAVVCHSKRKLPQ